MSSQAFTQAPILDTPDGKKRLSVVARLGALIATIGGLAMISILASITVAELSSGEARAINLAGSLRMQSYAIGAAIAEQRSSHSDTVTPAIAAFEERFRHPALAQAIPPDSGDRIRAAYDEVGSRWTQHFKPLALEAASGKKAVELSAGTTAMVARIDTLVALIEQNLEDKLQLLRLVQGVSLLLLVIVGTIAVHQLKQQVLHPLADLLRCARVVRKGDFSVRVVPRQPDELGQLGEAFNFMVEDLSQIYAKLESRVRDKTEELARSNQSLELLYSTTRALSERALTRSTLLQVLDEVERLTGVLCGALCLSRGESAGMTPLAADMPPGLLDTLCACADLELSPDTKHLAVLALPGETDGGRLISVPLFDGSRNHGAMFLVLPSGRELAPWHLQLLEAVGRHVGAALANTRRNEERHRLALLDERAVIARELHDSLAQSLSYLKIQVTRLHSLLARNPPPEPATGPVGEVVGELRDGLNEAYRQLRELLTTFRLRIDGRGLNAAIDDTVQEFSRRASLRIRLENHLGSADLTPSREIHVLQVIREALSNIERHARASHAHIVLEHLPTLRIRVSISDDGIGITPGSPPARHYGIAIMHDRARSLDGEISVSPGDAGGTHVELIFPALPLLPETPTISQASPP